MTSPAHAPSAETGHPPASKPSGVAAWQKQLANSAARIVNSPQQTSIGLITRATGLVLEASGLTLPVGAACRIQKQPNVWVNAEVVGFHDKTLYLMPYEDISGLPPNARVEALEGVLPPRVKASEADDDSPDTLGRKSGQTLPVGNGLLGRVLDARGKPLDHLGQLSNSWTAPLAATPINPLDRAPIDTPLDVGVRAINSLLTVGRGQRMGLFAGSGVGKSVLLGMMARYTKADIIVVGLIGERGREVKEFIEQNLGADGMARSIVVAAPADVSPLLRIQGCLYATRLAEFFRDQGKHVLLIMDSLTRYAMAQREIALAIGEPPATKGYPPSVFARLPALVERAGNGKEHNGVTSGSITAFYTVLTEGDDQQDPVADAARAVLDGHIVLSRQLAETGHYPAIDIEASISRVMNAVVDKAHFVRARKFKQMYSLYQRNRDLLAVGAYKKGNDPEIDMAIERYPFLRNFLMQEIEESASMEASGQALGSLFADLKL
ncbi:Flagellum-specific ATP synthase [Oligella ureolytica]|uniref:Flagellum-specific ATP synthase n=1 Tax=Oligella ureolytica TaxID=90244 RepID=A0A378XFQ2_9BURK|nr:flagellar protein export ATPase FliI [Oligella ureolytica]QPT39125.1 flagellar protein export ATPase FliI [Oligella ureolytica]SUA54877.1 Flagellum-specific ATP synthase [Oligella ureolytica]SUA56100.1 Flagellum-specific ATP synthase [Oligella ureolytica]